MAAHAVKSITSGSNARKSFGDIAPALADYTEKVLFGDLWERSNLSLRDRSLVTIAALMASVKCKMRDGFDDFVA